MLIRTESSRRIAVAALLVGVLLGGHCLADPPDLTAGGVPSDDPYITINLGPIGARGWVYHDYVDTAESRQILVTEVDSRVGSPARNILAVGDVILGADGTGANPANFSADARKTLGLAIGDAEARGTPELKLLVWNGGSTRTETLTLQTMGAYSSTAPYSCPKSSLILQQGLQYVYDNESAGRYSFGGITLLVTNNPTYRAKAQTIARALVPSAATMTQMMADVKDPSGGLPACERGHVLIFLAEYYLATTDAQVLPAIEAYAVNLAKNSSMFGTLGHGFADRNDDGTANGPITGGYGTVNTPALFALVGMVLARECGLTNPEITPAIERASNFFAFHTDKGAIPYGDHEPFFRQHENNGKCGTSALAFMFQTNRVEEAKFFAKMCTASATEREHGHTGAFFNYVWAPLGAAVGGPDMAAKLFGRLSWVYDLSRCWDGRFQYDCLNGEGHHSGSTWYDFRMSTAALLTYALPERQLRITGKGHDSSRWLTSTDADEAAAADDYDPDSRSDSELIADISNWSPKVRYEAGVELGTRSIDTSELNQITALATDAGGSSRSRAGACYALGQIGRSASADVLAPLLTDPDRYVRYFATEGMRYLPSSANLPHLATILNAVVSTAEPTIPIVAEDPLHMGHSKLAMLLFSSDSPKGVIEGNEINTRSVDRNLLYPAIRAVAGTPIGKGRSTLQATYENLTNADVLALAETILDSVIHRAPADVMFLHGIRAGGMSALHTYSIAEGVPAGMLYAENTYWNVGNRVQSFERLGAYGGSVLNVTPDPGTVPFLESYLADSEVDATVQGILNAIAADTDPMPLTAFKSITSATADATVLTLPTDSTVLRVSGVDHAQGDSVYTWRKTLGPGGFSISPNGTSNTVAALQLDGTPGAYQFEVTMSDARGLTEVHETVTVFLRSDGEVDDDPPLPNPAAFDSAPAADSETAISMTAATAADVTGPVQYLFTETTGNAGATSSSWQTSPSYTDSGLGPLTQYGYVVTMRDGLGNTTTSSSAVNVTTPGTPPPSDVMSVNFYAYGSLQVSDRHAVTLESDKSAGFGGWNTAGWENYSVPWGLSSPASPVSITSGQGSSATLTLNEVRNGGPYAWDAPHTILVGDGNGDLMDGHCNATEDPYDGSAIFDMTVSGVPFGTYDVIVYIGCNAAQYGDGDAKYVFNGGSEQSFTLTPGVFSSFAEITDSVTPGNYVVFENVTGTSFTFQMWGDGFNHIGPTGFQIASAGSTSDASPPTPDAATFAVAPYATGTDAISMTATTGNDASGPVEYLFSCLTAGGHGSGWQTSPSYTDAGLSAGTEYTYTVAMRDAVSPTPNATAASAGASVTTPGTPGSSSGDIFGVNFYAYGALDPADYDAVTLEAGESAGISAYNTNGWENYLLPWGLSSPASPVTITSADGETASLTLNDVRNGGPYIWGSPHSNLPGDGNGDLMDGHCNGTDDPYDGSQVFDMQVSGIPYTVYDLIVYLGANSAQFGDGKGKLVLNGGAEQGFTLPSGVFASFAELTDETTPGNYMVFTGLRNASLTLRVWGNGANHIGPTGFQIVEDVSGVIPPGPASNPNPADGVVGLPANTDLSWTAGTDATSRNVYFGTDATPDAGELQGNQAGTTFDPGTLAHGTYYWRIDEVNGDGTTTGPVWSFTVGAPAKAFRPMPGDGMTAVARKGVALSWVEGASASAVSSDVYFGTDSTPDAGEFRGNQTASTFSPGTLAAGTTYYWRIDQVNAQGTTTGDVWSFTTPKASANRVKIFILAGQSNTEGHGETDPVGTQGTLEHTVANDAATYGHLKDGASWAVRDDAWIWYKRGGTTLVKGGLTAGYGASSTTIGPELQFGHAMADYYGEKVLIIKTAWGGKSLRTDFRPPRSGWALDSPVTAGDEGFYYKEMLDFVVDATANLSTHFPAYDPADGYEIAGFGWHQGWNDRVTPAYAAEYETNMENFITDVRASLGVPNLPFVIATTGMDGNPDYSAVELAQLEMANAAAYPQFDGNVAVTNTQGFWFDAASSPANQGYHWNRNAKSYLLIGEAMAGEMQTLIEAGDVTSPSVGTLIFGM